MAPLAGAMRSAMCAPYDTLTFARCQADFWQVQGHGKVVCLSLTVLLAALLAGLQWVLWQSEALPEHPLKSLEERSEEDGEGKACNFYIALLPHEKSASENT